MKEGEFLKLKFLKLNSLNIAEWNASSDHLPQLQHLILQSCRQLKEVPSGFGDSSALEMIEVQLCTCSVEESVRWLQEEQLEMGNELKALIDRSDMDFDQLHNFWHIAVALPLAQPLPDISKIENFANENFRRWQERVHSLLDIHGVAYALAEAQPTATMDVKTQESWQYTNKVCRHTVLQTLSNELFAVYYSCKEVKTIWEALITKFITEDATKQKLVMEKYNQWQMTKNKDMKVQIIEYQMLLEDLKNEDINLLEKFAAGILIEKQPESWTDYKNNLKHKQKNHTIDQLVKYSLIEYSNRKELRTVKTKKIALKTNLVQTNNKRYANRSQHYIFNNPNFKKKKGNCYVCGKLEHHAAQCRYQKKGDKANANPPKVNLAEGDDNITAVISQVNIATNVKEWVVDSGVTRHICANREAFFS
ncbi:uncharacterized protein LOC113751937 [Coffea eugenioides]|uniref:uncharacterized protein LOC113751937 n=1 Tax=Coffea eugenioides TaxID=49369 RepID=UPI000F610DBA|nr:uncharacterized protein LOC113751937 [Coffea eugenioides]